MFAVLLLPLFPVAAPKAMPWSAATITAGGALIYQSGGTNPAVAVLDFGSDKTSTAGDFTIVFPAADSSNAIIRIA